jgi:hypothetical protein
MGVESDGECDGIDVLEIDPGGKQEALVGASGLITLLDDLDEWRRFQGGEDRAWAWLVFRGGTKVLQSP